MTPSIHRIAGLLVLLAAAPAAAQSEWGALALSERSTAYGYAYDFATQEGAAERALAECGKNARDCRVHTAFRNTCLVLAGSVDGPFGWAWGGPEPTRAARALEQCRQRGGINCRVVETVCAGTAGGPPAPRTAIPPPARPAAAAPPSLTTPPVAATPPATTPPPAATATSPDTRAPGAPTPLHRQ